jgi:hypothetical protein
MLDVCNDVAENVTDGRAQQRENDDHDDCDQNKNQCVLNKTLASFLRCEQHATHLLSVMISPVFCYKLVAIIGIHNPTINRTNFRGTRVRVTQPLFGISWRKCLNFTPEDRLFREHDGDASPLTGLGVNLELTIQLFHLAPEAIQRPILHIFLLENIRLKTTPVILD